MAKLNEHKDVAQALIAADALVRNPLIMGYTLDYSPIQPPGMPFPYRCTFSSGRVLPKEWGRYQHTGTGFTLAKAIYQAIKEVKRVLPEEDQP